jgi:hypothetical protein
LLCRLFRLLCGLFRLLPLCLCFSLGLCEIHTNTNIHMNTNIRVTYTYRRILDTYMCMYHAIYMDVCILCICVHERIPN